MNQHLRGYFLGSQDLDEAAKDGKIAGIDLANLTKSISVASVDMRLGETAWEIDRAIATRLRWEGPVYEAIKQLSIKDARKIDLTKGDVARAGYTYVAPCLEQFVLEPLGPSPLSFERLVNSPKSTSARLFSDVRVFFEGHSLFDELSNASAKGKVQPWVLLDPNHISYTIQSGLALTQMRWSKGYDTKLTAQEIFSEHEKHGIFNHYNNGKITPVKNLDIDASNNVRLSLNLHSRDGQHSRYALSIHPHVGYILESQEYLKVPAHLSLSMVQYSGGGIRVITEKGGFFDAGFCGSAIAEIESLERMPRTLHHGDRVLSFELHRHAKDCSRTYNALASSNYRGQVGAKFAKQFSPSIDPRSVIGWKTIHTSDVLDMQSVGTQPILRFYEGIYA